MLKDSKSKENEAVLKGCQAHRKPDLVFGKLRPTYTYGLGRTAVIWTDRECLRFVYRNLNYRVNSFNSVSETVSKPALGRRFVSSRQ